MDCRGVPGLGSPQSITPPQSFYYQFMVFRADCQEYCMSKKYCPFLYSESVYIKMDCKGVSRVGKSLAPPPHNFIINLRSAGTVCPRSLDPFYTAS